MLSMVLVPLLAISAVPASPDSDSSVVLQSDATCLRVEGTIVYRFVHDGKVSVTSSGVTITGDGPPCLSYEITGFRIGVAQHNDVHFGSESWSDWQRWSAIAPSTGTVKLPNETLMIDLSKRDLSTPAEFVVVLRTSDNNGSESEVFSGTGRFSFAMSKQ